MLAVLSSAIEDFQEYVLAQSVSGKKLFEEAEEWILEKHSDWFVSLEKAQQRPTYAIRVLPPALIPLETLLSTGIYDAAGKSIP
jgi:hypothetical protein